jgi:predicted metalloprotease with PDZ domain
MRMLFLSLCGLALAASSLTAAPAPPAVSVELRPVHMSGAFSAIDVSVRFRGELDGQTVLNLPDAWGGEDDLWRALHDIRSEGAELGPGADEAHRALRHAPGAWITVRYRVMQEAPGEPAAGRRNPYRPVVQPTYFHVLGNALVALPANVSQRATAHFAITGMPTGATFASDAQHKGLTVEALVESVVVGGDFRIVDAGGGLRVAIRGAWPSADDVWRTRLARVGAAQRTYWRASTEPYLVTVIPIVGDVGAMSVGGTGRDDGFALFATTNAPGGVVERVLGHEMMHTWIPRRIGGMPSSAEEADYWLSEGFTDWASWRVNVRSGVWSIEDFANTFNEALSAYDLSPVRTAPNTRILEAYWADADVQKLPYQRGMLIATLWDHRVRVATRGARNFDDVLLLLQSAARRRPDITAVHLLPHTVRRVAGVEVGTDMTELVAEGRSVELPQDVFAPCGKVVAKASALWVRGFDFEATQRAGWKIQGITEGNAAWRAGLRDGMLLLQWSERSNARDATKPVTAGVEDNGARRDITWLPTDGSSRPVRQLVLQSDMTSSQRAECKLRLGGR